MRAAVEPLPLPRVGEPEVGAAVDDHAWPRPARRRSRRTGRAAAPGRRRRGRPGPPTVVGSSTRSASGTRCGWRAPSGWPALLAPVRAPISTPGWPSSRRSSSPPAYPLAPATATLALLMLHDYTEFCMTMKLGCRRRWTPLASQAWSRCPSPTYLDHIRTESARFREVLADCDPTARVPACPDWDAADLLWHLAGVQAFWADVIRTRPADADEDAEGEAGAAGVLRRPARRLRRALRRPRRRARGGRPRRRGLALVGRPHGRARASAVRRTRR